MPDETFWRNRFRELGVHSVGPGDTTGETELEIHRQHFVRGLKKLLPMLHGPVLDFGCGVGRWVNDLPRPYVGLDLLPEHLEVCRQRHPETPEIQFRPAQDLASLAPESFGAIFTCTVLQHIPDRRERAALLAQFNRILMPEGTLLSVEWSEGQREYDWCTAVKRREYERWFEVRSAGEVVEEIRRHSIWVGTKIRDPRRGGVWRKGLKALRTAFGVRNRAAEQD